MASGKLAASIALIISTAVAFVALVIVMALQYSNFVSSEFASQKFADLSVWPAKWVQFGWLAAYVWLLVVIVYWHSVPFRSFNGGGRLSQRNGVLTAGTLFMLIVSFAGNAVWYVLYEQKPYIVTIFLLVMAIGAFASLGISQAFLHIGTQDLMSNGHEKEVKIVIGIVHNGLAMFATFPLMAICFHLGLIMKDTALTWNANVVETTVLCCILGAIVVYMVIDLVVFEPHFRYVFTPYIVFIFVNAASMASSQSWNLTSSAVSIIQLAWVILSLVALLLKIVLAVYQARSNPIYRDQLFEYFTPNEQQDDDGDSELTDDGGKIPTETNPKTTTTTPMTTTPMRTTWVDSDNSGWPDANQPYSTPTVPITPTVPVTPSYVDDGDAGRRMFPGPTNIVVIM